MMALLLGTFSRRQKSQWARIFGRETLPVLYGRPDTAVEKGAEMPIYKLDLKALNFFEVTRLAGDVATRSRRPYAEVLDEMLALESWPIDGRSCFIVNE